MSAILAKGTQVRVKGAAPAPPWCVVGQGRHGIICRRSEGGNVTTRCFKPDELQPMNPHLELIRSHAVSNLGK